MERCRRLAGRNDNGVSRVWISSARGKHLCIPRWRQELGPEWTQTAVDELRLVRRWKVSVRRSGLRKNISLDESWIVMVIHGRATQLGQCLLFGRWAENLRCGQWDQHGGRSSLHLHRSRPHVAAARGRTQL